LYFLYIYELKISKRTANNSDDASSASSFRVMPKIKKTGHANDQKNSRITLTRGNRFTPLQLRNVNDDLQKDTENMDDDDSSHISLEKQIKIPPLTILKKNSINAAYVHNLMAENKIEDYYIKNLSIGIKIFSKNVDACEKISNLLKGKQIEFYTYQNKSDKPFKVLLSGLDEIPQRK
jgi:hypothetical protein